MTKGVCDVCSCNEGRRPHGEVTLSLGLPDWWHLCKECAVDTDRFLVHLRLKKGVPIK